MIRIGNYLCMMLYYLIRPLLGPAQCRYQESCGPYAIRQLQQHSLIPALKAICIRVGSCAPWPAHGNWLIKARQILGGISRHTILHWQNHLCK